MGKTYGEKMRKEPDEAQKQNGGYFLYLTVNTGCRCSSRVWDMKTRTRSLFMTQTAFLNVSGGQLNRCVGLNQHRAHLPM